jgi:hypothetical protein
VYGVPQQAHYILGYSEGYVSHNIGSERLYAMVINFFVDGLLDGCRQ